MSLTPEETLARARGDLRIGAPVVFTDGDAAAVAVATEVLSAERLAALRSAAPDGIELVLTRRRAETLKARAYDGDLARIELPADFGIRRIQAAADPALALAHPMIGPFIARREGSAGPERMALRLAKAARLLPAVVAAPIPAEAARALAASEMLTLIDAPEMRAVEAMALDLSLVSSGRVPLGVAEDARVHVWRPRNGEEEHYAIEIGAPDRAAPVLTRLHSACFTGDLIGSLKCDCGPQLRAALGQIGAEGAGVLLYLNQEGRGIGLANKMRAYSLQDDGFDTVEANHRLGFEDDERDFRIGTEILRSMGFSRVRLLTNNPAKVAAMNAEGLHVVERAPLIVGKTAHNLRYLATKAQKSGHLL
ncbi:GTP cyclohydrolase II [Pikeienuella piscinae]|uniref:GTP cyclohydrolase-2 n=1 Tax=Pikeienuella piscinae TaxID=2748098 RepID=A0A7M3T793_9RHOB|nr:GTP cyclohydrolase II [Pikeienuella piscinae]QIE57874.1 GTP cyclohydrolase II [Pikeienuella piscinae]